MSIHIQKLEFDGSGQTCEKSKCWLLILRSQTLIDFIFKFDLNFEKWMQIHTRKVKISQDGQNGKKSQNVDFRLAKVKLWIWFKC